MFIAVVGDSECTPEVAQWAEEVGQELARRGATVLCGGLTGVMEAVCRGAKKAHGLTIGILPTNDRLDANKYVDIPIVTGLGQARNIIIVKSAQAVIAVSGKYGTLSEIALALSHGIPVIGLHTWSLSREGLEDNSIIVALSPQEAVEKAISLAKGGQP
ncbi:MAG: TIGR00725 family protein [Chloroflexi bacterium]|nr:TIGR00725 family protein [Chloroflexota bacterium]